MRDPGYRDTNNTGKRLAITRDDGNQQQQTQQQQQQQQTLASDQLVDVEAMRLRIAQLEAQLLSQAAAAAAQVGKQNKDEDGDDDDDDTKKNTEPWLLGRINVPLGSESCPSLAAESIFSSLKTLAVRLDPPSPLLDAVVLFLEQERGRVDGVALDNQKNDLVVPLYAFPKPKDEDCAMDRLLLNFLFPSPVRPDLQNLPAQLLDACRPVPPSASTNQPRFNINLKNNLKRFQERNVQWMLNREQKKSTPLFIEKVKTADGNNLEINRLTGDLHFEPEAESLLQGGILADEMGLGKTVDILALILANQMPVHLQREEAKIQGRTWSAGTLIICPSTLVSQWISEIKKHTDLNFYHYKGRKHENKESDEDLIKRLIKFDIVITSYHVLESESSFASEDHRVKRRNDRKYKRLSSPLTKIRFWRGVLDEAQMVENKTSKTAQLARQIFLTNRWAVTGTPIAKHGVEDLEGLGIFLGLEDAMKTMSRCRKAGNYQPLFVVFPRIMRRNRKVDVNDELCIPEQKQFVVELKFGQVEQFYYDGLDKNELVQKRQACIHPQLGELNKKSFEMNRKPAGTISEVRNILIQQNIRKSTSLLLDRLTQQYDHARILMQQKKYYQSIQQLVDTERVIRQISLESDLRSRILMLKFQISHILAESFKAVRQRQDEQDARQKAADFLTEVMRRPKTQFESHWTAWKTRQSPETAALLKEVDTWMKDAPAWLCTVPIMSRLIHQWTVVVDWRTKIIRTLDTFPVPTADEYLLENQDSQREISSLLSHYRLILFERRELLDGTLENASDSTAKNRANTPVDDDCERKRAMFKLSGGVCLSMFWSNTLGESIRKGKGGQWTEDLRVFMERGIKLLQTSTLSLRTECFQLFDPVKSWTDYSFVWYEHSEFRRISKDENDIKAAITRIDAELEPLVKGKELLQSFSVQVTTSSPALPAPSTNTYSHPKLDPSVYNAILTHRLKSSTSSYGSKIDFIIKHLLYIQVKYPREKCIIFSQWVEVFDILERVLIENNIQSVRMDKDKNNAVAKFQTVPNIRVMMLNSRSQSCGLNIVEATHVLILEPVFNRAIELQAINRVYRIGQTKPTFVYRYIVQETIEERILQVSQDRNPELTEAKTNSDGTEIISDVDGEVLLGVSKTNGGSGGGGNNGASSGGVNGRGVSLPTPPPTSAPASVVATGMGAKGSSVTTTTAASTSAVTTVPASPSPLLLPSKKDPFDLTDDEDDEMEEDEEEEDSELEIPLTRRSKVGSNSQSVALQQQQQKLQQPVSKPQPIASSGIPITPPTSRQAAAAATAALSKKCSEGCTPVTRAEQTRCYQFHHREYQSKGALGLIRRKSDGTLSC
ncbi:UNVERIFIED_CONTAM: hypothetical protein HDU68_011296, partial [Siphonaria sp. JEL0065]